jgi:indolepyruvate ferredoxin oxidoreductase alpha subunit
MDAGDACGVCGAGARAVSGFDRSPRWVVFPRRAFEGHLEILERLPKVAAEFSASTYNELVNTHDSAPAHLGIAAGGISYAYLRDALAQADSLAQAGAGQPTGPLRLLKVGTPFPFPEALALEFLDGLSEVLVLEELEPVIERELLQLVGKHRLPTRILGKLTKTTTQAGENSVNTIAEQVAVFCAIDSPAFATAGRAAGAAATAAAGRAAGAASPKLLRSSLPASPTPPELPARPPVLCAGCPHRASFYAVKKALRGRAAVFSGDIGCYTLGNAQPLDMVDTCVCMGAGFTVPQGMDWAQPDVLHLGFMGDSTFFASGLTGAVNAVYNRSKVTLCVLDNSTTAMTGSQPHPGCGRRMSFDAAATAARDEERALRIPGILSALGIEHTVQVDPFDLEVAVEAVRKAVACEGVSAIVFKAPCITVAPPRPQPTVCANTCTNCKLCIRSIGCPALLAHEGKVVIDTAQCYGCGLCAQVCPFNAIVPEATHE